MQINSQLNAANKMHKETTVSAPHSCVAVSFADRWIAGYLVRHTPVPLALRLWDGSMIRTERDPLATVALSRRRALWRIAVNPMLAFGDAYAAGELQVIGDLARLMEAFHRAPPAAAGYGGRLAAFVRQAVARPNSKRRSRASAEAHYNLGNDFFQRWLDPAMLYTCAYYSTESTSLADAQKAKMEHVCRKLRLRPGQRVVDVGCGWGGLAIHMARHHAVTVDGYCVASEQVDFARARATAAGVEDRVRFHRADYRDVRGKFDAFVSLGMLEHVGRRYHLDLAAVIDRCLAAGGVGLLHSEGRMRAEPINPWFERRVFPGAHIPSLAEMVRVVDAAGCTVYDVENLGPHYALTLGHWLMQFEHIADEAGTQYGEDFVRLWRLYLTSGMAAFRSGSLHLFQLLFARRGERVLPLTRGDLYNQDSSSVPSVTR